MTTPPPPPDDLPRLPPRDPDSHKGTHGTVAVIGGCASLDARMIGAPALTAIAALRAGAGLARIVAPAPVLDAALTIAPSATGVPLTTDAHGEIIPHEAAAVIDALLPSSACLTVGPGLGRGPGARAATLRAVQQQEAPAVIDADAINALAQTPDLFRDFHAAAILTPHPGEFKRLSRSLGLKNGLGIDQSRPRAAEALAQRLGRIIVLKGRNTVVSDGQRTWTNPSGHPCLATGGTGDVLTGLIAALIAQFAAPIPAVALPVKVPTPPDKPLDLYDAARVAVWIHGRAGEIWADTHSADAGLLAHELCDLLPPIIQSLRKEK